MKGEGTGGEREREREGGGGGREDWKHIILNCALEIRVCLFFRRLLFLSIDDILGDEAVVSGDPLPHSYVLDFLFSRAPSEMRSPHQVNNIYLARTNFIYIHIHVHVYVHIILILLHVCSVL